MTIQQAFALALQHHQAGRLGEAEALYRQILATQPNHADAQHLLGAVAHQAGRQDLAVELIRRAIVLNPGDSAAHYNIGETYRTMGRLDEAVASFGRALQLKPDLPEAHNNLGIALAEQGRLDEAVAAYRRALQSKPDYPEAWNNLGIALAELGQLDEALAAYRRALELKPDYPEAHNNLGLALAHLIQLDEAVIAYRRALEFRPDYPEAHNNLGIAFVGRNQLDEALAAYRRALELKPDYPDAWNNLGRVLKDQGLLDDALAAYRRAMQLMPGKPSAYSNLVYTLHFHPGHDGRTIAEEHQRWNQQFAEPLKRLIRAHPNDRTPERRLRIGYVSPDFREHVVGFNLVPLLEQHDRGKFEILCYSGVVRPDSLTGRFHERADQWRNTVGVGNEALAEMIRRDGVDILVDLSQHMAAEQLLVFARQPAPIQVSFACYPESTGLEAIGYRISDRYLEGGAERMKDEGGRMNRSEQVSLIDSFWCYDPCEFELEVNGLPARESGRVTFGCLNNFCKINEPVLRLWARVLGQVKDSRLVLLTGAGSHRQRTLESFEREGVEAHRVEFEELRPRRAYVELYHRLDMALDPFPYNGHTTSLDALWMGVPIVSLVGERAVSRAGLSQMSNLGLPELVAFSEDDYVRIATQLAHDLPRLAELRATLRSRMQASLMMDARRFARDIEAAYRAMWQAWCAKQSGHV